MMHDACMMDDGYMMDDGINGGDLLIVVIE
jgi:hypothetical protein